MILTLARGVGSRQSRIMLLYALSLLIVSISSPITHPHCLVRHYGFVFLDGMQAGRDELGVVFVEDLSGKDRFVLDKSGISEDESIHLQRDKPHRAERIEPILSGENLPR